MRVQLYRLNYPGWDLVNEYYRWNLTWPQGQQPRGHRLSCPGCGRDLNYQAVTQGHQCPGTLTADPVKPNHRAQRRGRPRKNEAERMLGEYAQKSRHRIVYSE